MPDQTAITTKCLFLDDSGALSESVGQLLSNQPGMEVHAAQIAFEAGIRAVRKLRPDIVIVAGDTPEVATVVESLDAATPEAPVMVLFPSEEPETARQCVLAGAQLCLHALDSPRELVDGIQRIVARERRRRSMIVAQATGTQEKPARVLTFHSAKGGSGTTTIAVNTAIALHKLTKKRVVLVDGAMQAADVGAFMDIQHNASIADLLPHLKELDGDLLDEVMAKHSSGVQVLLAPTQLERAELVTGEQFAVILAVLRKNADFILIDTPPVLDSVTMCGLDAAEQVVLVSTPEVAGLRNTARFLQLAAKLGYPADKVFLLLNRAGSKGSVSLADIKTHLRHEVGWQVRSSGRSFVEAANKGIPVATNNGRFGPSKSFRQLAIILDASQQAAKRRERALKASWLKRDKAKATGDQSALRNPSL